MEFVVPLILIGLWYGITPSARERVLLAEKRAAESERDLARAERKLAELAAAAMHAHLGPIEALAKTISREHREARERKHGPRSLELLQTEDGRLERLAGELQCKIARAREACPR